MDKFKTYWSKLVTSLYQSDTEIPVNTPKNYRLKHHLLDAVLLILAVTGLLVLLAMFLRALPYAVALVLIVSSICYLVFHFRRYL